MPKQKQHKVSLALQGGGSHGAYTWGILDRLLDEECLEIEAISGTSAGAMNGAVLVDGYIKGGRKGAKQALRHFWHHVSEIGKYNPITASPFSSKTDQWNLDHSPLYAFFDMMTRLYSPYQINPYNINPLRDLLESTIDFDNIHNSHQIDLFVTATSVTTGQPHIFNHTEITPDTLMASACLPSLFQAVDINDDHFWDGGYAGNPAIWPLTYQTETTDIIIVEINPVARKQKPVKGTDINNRINEISFNASLLAELKSIHFINELIEENHLVAKKYRKLHMHLIESPDAMLELNASSKMNTRLDFLQYLHTLGRESAEQWLKKNRASLGVCTSLDKGMLKHGKHKVLKKKTAS